MTPDAPTRGPRQGEPALRVPATATLVIGFLTLGLAGTARAQSSYLRTDLVSDLAGHAAHQDSSPVNPWGILVGPGGHLFVADNGTGLLTMCDRAGAHAALVFAAGLNDEADGLVGRITVARPDTGHIAPRRPGHGAALRVALQGVNPVRLSAPPQVSFRIEAPAAAPVSLSIYDAMGRRVAQPARLMTILDSGDVSWDGHDQRGAPVPSGAYFYRAIAGDQVASGRLVIVH